MSWTTEITMNPGWDAGARTIAQLSGDGGYTFSVGQALGIVCGFNDVDTGPGYTEINFAFHIESTRVRIVENGEPKTSWESFSPGAVFKIERISGDVRYYVDDVLKYTSTTPSTGDVFLDCSLYHYMDEIFDATMYEIRRAESDIEISPLAAYAGVDDATFANISIHPLSVASRAHVTQKLEIELPKLIAVAHTAGVEAFVAIDLHPLSAQGSEALWVPEYNAAHIQTLPLQAGGTDIPFLHPVVDAEVSPLTARAMEAWAIPDPDIEVALRLSPLVALAFTQDAEGAIPDYISAGVNVSPLSVASSTQDAEEKVLDYNIAHADLLPLEVETYLGQSRFFSFSLPTPEVTIAAADYGLYGSLPALTGEIRGRITGVTIQGDLPSLAGAGLFSGTSLVTSMPSLEGSMTAKVQRKADIAATMPGFSGQMQTGAHVAATMPRLSGTLEATIPVHADIAASFRGLRGDMDVQVPNLSGINFSLRAFSGVLEAHTDTSTRIAGTMPRLSGSMGVLAESGGDIEGSLPMLRGRLSGGRLVDHSITAAMPMPTGAMRGAAPRIVGVQRYVRASS